MGRAIWKFALIDTMAEVGGAIVMPKGAKVLCVKTQNEMPYLWAEVDPEADTEVRKFAIFGTGESIPVKRPMTYIGTYMVHGGNYVWHVYELEKEDS